MPILMPPVPPYATAYCWYIYYVRADGEQRPLFGPVFSNKGIAKQLAEWLGSYLTREGMVPEGVSQLKCFGRASHYSYSKLKAGSLAFLREYFEHLPASLFPTHRPGMKVSTVPRWTYRIYFNCLNWQAQLKRKAEDAEPPPTPQDLKGIVKAAGDFLDAVERIRRLRCRHDDLIDKRMAARSSKNDPGRTILNSEEIDDLGTMQMGYESTVHGCCVTLLGAAEFYNLCAAPLEEVYLDDSPDNCIACQQLVEKIAAKATASLEALKLSIATSPTTAKPDDNGQPIHADGWFSATEIAAAMDVPAKAEAIRKALGRLMQKRQLSLDASMENENRAQGQSKFLFRLSLVRPHLAKYEAK